MRLISAVVCARARARRPSAMRSSVPQICEQCSLCAYAWNCDPAARIAAPPAIGSLDSVRQGCEVLQLPKVASRYGCADCGFRPELSDPAASVRFVSSPVIAMSDDALLAAWRELEVRRRKLAADEHALIAEIAARGLAHSRGARSTAALAVQLLRISPGEARARVHAAEDLGPRRGLTGEPLEPIYPLVASAQAEGAISPATPRSSSTRSRSFPMPRASSTRNGSSATSSNWPAASTRCRSRKLRGTSPSSSIRTGC